MPEDLQPAGTTDQTEKVIGTRELTWSERNDALICGLTALDVADMTSDELHQLANFIADFAGNHLGS